MDLSLRHLPDLSDASVSLSFSFQLPTDGGDDLLRADARDFGIGLLDDEREEEQPEQHNASLTLSELEPLALNEPAPSSPSASLRPTTRPNIHTPTPLTSSTTASRVPLPKPATLTNGHLRQKSENTATNTGNDKDAGQKPTFPALKPRENTHTTTTTTNTNTGASDAPPKTKPKSTVRSKPAVAVPVPQAAPPTNVSTTNATDAKIGAPPKSHLKSKSKSTVPPPKLVNADTDADADVAGGGADRLSSAAARLLMYAPLMGGYGYREGGVDMDMEKETRVGLESASANGSTSVAAASPKTSAKTSESTRAESTMAGPMAPQASEAANAGSTAVFVASNVNATKTSEAAGTTASANANSSSKTVASTAPPKTSESATPNAGSTAAPGAARKTGRSKIMASAADGAKGRSASAAKISAPPPKAARAPEPSASIPPTIAAPPEILAPSAPESDATNTPPAPSMSDDASAGASHDVCASTLDASVPDYADARTDAAVRLDDVVDAVGAAPTRDEEIQDAYADANPDTHGVFDESEEILVDDALAFDDVRAMDRDTHTQTHAHTSTPTPHTRDDSPLTLSQLSPRKRDAPTPGSPDALAFDLQADILDADAIAAQIAPAPAHASADLDALKTNAPAQKQKKKSTAPAVKRPPSPMRPAAKRARPASAASTVSSELSTAMTRASGKRRVPSDGINAASGGMATRSTTARAPSDVVGMGRRSTSARVLLGGTRTAAARERGRGRGRVVSAPVPRTQPKVSSLRASASTRVQASTKPRPEWQHPHPHAEAGSSDAQETRMPLNTGTYDASSRVLPTSQASTGAHDAPANVHAKSYTVPDFKALHASLAASLAARRPPVAATVPVGTVLSTDVRAKERRVWEEEVRVREAALEAARAKEQAEREEREALEVKEARKKAVVKAHDVPEWYKEAPRRGEGAGGAKEGEEGANGGRTSAGNSESCSTAFHVDTYTTVQVACQTNNVNLIITFWE
ncbi:hypothetical protein C8R44DRAFT_887719 [Mycena epipterygia]|nr:hypothetical protein C8R44DRAFT_887719 [Mycena epipterygia]